MTPSTRRKFSPHTTSRWSCSDQMKRAIPQIDAAIVIGVGQVAAVAQCAHHVSPGFRAGVPAGLMRGTVHGLLHRSAGVLLNGCDE